MTVAVAKTYSSKNGYSIVAPAGWTVDTSKKANSDVIFMGKQANGFRPNLSVTVTASGGQNLSQVRSYINTAYPRVFKNYQKLGQGNTKLGGVPAVFVSATHKTGSPNTLVRMYQVIALRKGAAYIVTCTARNADYAKSDAAFKKALASMKWK
jgi:hypothetical protein